MSRFFFHTDDGKHLIDEDGVDLAGQAEARLEAVRVLGEMLKEQPEAFWRDGGLRLTVTDARALVLFVLEATATDAAAAAPLRRP